MPHQELIIDGERWPSVTEIGALLTKPSLNKWREFKGTKEADRISKEAAERGRTLHDLVERHLKGEVVSFCGENIDLEPVFKAWFDWWITSTYVCKWNEGHVKSTKYKYHGTLDAIIRSLKGDYIVDWKFSNNDDNLRVLQLAGYAQAYYDEYTIKIKRGLIVRVDKLGKVHIKEYKNLWKYVPLFLGLRRVWDFVNQQGKFKKK